MTTEYSLPQWLLIYRNCYRYGVWREDVPYLSTCPFENCGRDDISYCSKSSYKCLNKFRDEYFYRKYQFDSYTDYYPSDEDITKFADKRIGKLMKVKPKPYHWSGEKMIQTMREACETYQGSCCDSDEAWDEALSEIRAHGYNISIKRFKIIFAKYFN